MSTSRSLVPSPVDVGQRTGRPADTGEAERLRGIGKLERIAMQVSADPALRTGEDVEIAVAVDVKQRDSTGAVRAQRSEL